MQKIEAKIFVGGVHDDRIERAKTCCNFHSKGEIVWIDGQSRKVLKSPKLYSGCTEQTKIIVIDGLGSVEILNNFFNIITKGIRVYTSILESFVIFPELILIMDDKIQWQDLPSDGSFLRRFEIVVFEDVDTSILAEIVD